MGFNMSSLILVRGVHYSPVSFCFPTTVPFRVWYHSFTSKVSKLMFHGPPVVRRKDASGINWFQPIKPHVCESMFYMYLCTNKHECIGCSERRLIGHSTHTSHKDTEQSTIEISITLSGVTLTDCSGDHRMNDLQFAGRYKCLPIRCSGRLISLRNEHPVWMNECMRAGL
jgi:hypothetical protein